MLTTDKKGSNKGTTQEDKGPANFKMNGTNIINTLRQRVSANSDEAYHEILTESFGSLSGIKTTIVPGSSLGLEVDSLVFVKETDSSVVVATMLIDSPDKSLGNTSEKIGGREVNVPVMYGDIITSEDDYITALTQYLKNTYEKEVEFAMFNVIPRLMLERADTKDRLPKQLVNRLWTEVESAIASFINDMDLPVAAVGGRFKFRPEFNSDETSSATGLPLFREWEVNTRTATQDKDTSRARTSSINLATLGGYTDFTYCNTEAYTEQGRHFAKTWEYNFYINNVVSEMGYSNLSTVLLSLASFASMLRGNTRYVPIKRMLNDKVRNLSTLNEDLADEHAFDVSSKEFTIGGFKETYIHDDSKLILLVPECTELSTWLSVIEQSGTDGQAREAVLASAASLCAKFNRDGEIIGDYFTEEFDPSTPIGYNIDNQVVLNGYYTDQNDVEHDLAGFNYIAARNEITNQNMFDEYDRTFTDVDIDLEVRLSERVRIQREIFPNVVFTGRSRLFEIDIDFLSALWNGITKAMGGNFDIEVNQDIEERQTRRGMRHTGRNGLTQQNFNLDSRTTSTRDNQRTRANLRSTRNNRDF